MSYWITGILKCRVAVGWICSWQIGKGKGVGANRGVVHEVMEVKIVLAWRVMSPLGLLFQPMMLIKESAEMPSLWPLGNWMLIAPFILVPFGAVPVNKVKLVIVMVESDSMA